MLNQTTRRSHSSRKLKKAEQAVILYAISMLDDWKVGPIGIDGTTV